MQQEENHFAENTVTTVRRDHKSIATKTTTMSPSPSNNQAVTTPATTTGGNSFSLRPRLPSAGSERSATETSLTENCSEGRPLSGNSLLHNMHGGEDKKSRRKMGSFLTRMEESFKRYEHAM